MFKEMKSMWKNLPGVPRRFLLKHLGEMLRLPFVRLWGVQNDEE